MDRVSESCVNSGEIKYNCKCQRVCETKFCTTTAEPHFVIFVCYTYIIVKNQSRRCFLLFFKLATYVQSNQFNPINKINSILLYNNLFIYPSLIILFHYCLNNDNFVYANTSQNIPLFLLNQRSSVEVVIIRECSKTTTQNSVHISAIQLN